MLAAKSEGLVGTSAEKVLDLTVFQAEQAFKDLEGWALSEEAAGLAEHEVEVELEQRGREVHRLLLQAHLNQRGSGAVGPVIQVERGEGRVEHSKKKGRRDPKQIASIFGEVSTDRTAYAARGTTSVHPLDEELELPKRSYSYELQRRIVGEAVKGPFEEVVESLVKSTGHTLSKRSVDQIVADAAEDFDAFYRNRAGPAVAGTGAILVAQFDGKGIPMRKEEEGPKPPVRLKKGEKRNKKRIATVAVVQSQAPRIRTAEEVTRSLFSEERSARGERTRPKDKRVWASLKKGKDDVIQDAVAELAIRDPERKKLWCALTDGEKALQCRVKKYLPGVVLILDLIHALERLWVAAHAFHGEGTGEAAEWVRRHALMLLQGKASQVVKGMRQSVTKRRLRGRKKKAVLTAAAYLYRNRPHMKYDEYLALGLPIATGAVEGACRHYVKDRMERSGMRWTQDGAEAMLRLRALKVSGDLEEYWSFHIQQDQQRLYGSQPWRKVS